MARWATLRFQKTETLGPVACIPHGFRVIYSGGARSVSLTPKTAEEIQGYEYDWIAHDEFGHVALFSTAGGGYAPPEFLADTVAFDDAVEALLTLNATSSASMFQEVAVGLVNTWKGVAERGLFSFDSDSFGGPYRRAGTPDSPVSVEDLPPLVAEVVRRVRLRGVRFESAGEITREELELSSRG